MRDRRGPYTKPRQGAIHSPAELQIRRERVINDFIWPGIVPHGTVHKKPNTQTSGIARETHRLKQRVRIVFHLTAQQDQAGVNAKYLVALRKVALQNGTILAI